MSAADTADGPRTVLSQDTSTDVERQQFKLAADVLTLGPEPARTVCPTGAIFRPPERPTAAPVCV